jgi:hypothetical protein
MNICRWWIEGITLWSWYNKNVDSKFKIPISQALVSFKKYMPPPLPYFKVNICPFPLSHFASICFTYLWFFRWPNYIAFIICIGTIICILHLRGDDHDGIVTHGRSREFRMHMKNSSANRKWFFPLSHFASIFFTYLWSFRWPNYIVTLPRYFSFRLPHLNIATGATSDEFDKNSQWTQFDAFIYEWVGSLVLVNLWMWCFQIPVASMKQNLIEVPPLPTVLTVHHFKKNATTSTLFPFPTSLQYFLFICDPFADPIISLHSRDIYLFDCHI